jgi:hypothetical protein
MLVCFGLVLFTLCIISPSRVASRWISHLMHFVSFLRYRFVVVPLFVFFFFFSTCSCHISSIVTFLVTFMFSRYHSHYVTLRMPHFALALYWWLVSWHHVLLLLRVGNVTFLCWITPAGNVHLPAPWYFCCCRCLCLSVTLLILFLWHSETTRWIAWDWKTRSCFLMRFLCSMMAHLLLFYSETSAGACIYQGGYGYGSQDRQRRKQW